jgi:hypothetical protein
LTLLPVLILLSGTHLLLIALVLLLFLGMLLLLFVLILLLFLGALWPSRLLVNDLRASVLRADDGDS